MAHFRATIQGNRGPASRLGSASSGIEATVNGWDGGVRVVASSSAGGAMDRFDIYATHGSGHGHADGFIGHVVGGTFIPRSKLSPNPLLHAVEDVRDQVRTIANKMRERIERYERALLAIAESDTLESAVDSAKRAIGDGPYYIDIKALP